MRTLLKTFFSALQTQSSSTSNGILTSNSLLHYSGLLVRIPLQGNAWLIYQSLTDIAHTLLQCITKKAVHVKFKAYFRLVSHSSNQNFAIPHLNHNHSSILTIPSHSPSHGESFIIPALNFSPFFFHSLIFYSTPSSEHKTLHQGHNKRMQHSIMEWYHIKCYAEHISYLLRHMLNIRYILPGAEQKTMTQ